MPNGVLFRDFWEEDMKVLQEKWDKLVKVIEGAGFILAGIEMAAMSRTPTEKPMFTLCNPQGDQP
jgi:NhaP-type Na+/H+ or K+/H+ antiporter